MRLADRQVVLLSIIVAVAGLMLIASWSRSESSLGEVMVVPAGSTVRFSGEAVSSKELAGGVSFLIEGSCSLEGVVFSEDKVIIPLHEPLCFEGAVSSFKGRREIVVEHVERGFCS